MRIYVNRLNLLEIPDSAKSSLTNCNDVTEIEHDRNQTKYKVIFQKQKEESDIEHQI